MWLAGADPELDQVRQRLHDLERDGLTLDGVPLDNDLTESNHFVDVFELSDRPTTETGAQRSRVLLHHALQRPRTPQGQRERGPGLYYDQSEQLRSMARRLQTPWGSLHILEDGSAAQWLPVLLPSAGVQSPTSRSPSQFLFGEFDVVVNATHQGLVRGLNRANLGCYTFEPGAEDESLFPLTLSPTLPAYLVRGRPSFADETVSALGWARRLDQHGLREHISGANILPHGGGYRFDSFRGVARVVDGEPDERRFVLEPTNSSDEPTIIAAPSELSYGYRGMEVRDRMESLNLGTAVIELDLKYVLDDA